MSQKKKRRNAPKKSPAQNKAVARQLQEMVQPAAPKTASPLPVGQWHMPEPATQTNAFAIARKISEQTAQQTQDDAGEVVDLLEESRVQNGALFSARLGQAQEEQTEEQQLEAEARVLQEKEEPLQYSIAQLQEEKLPKKKRRKLRKNQLNAPVQRPDFQSLPAQERLAFIAAAGKHQRNKRKTLLCKRVLGLCAGVALFLSLSVAVQYLQARGELPLWFARLGAVLNVGTSQEVIDLPMPEGYGEAQLPEEEIKQPLSFDTWELLLTNTTNPLPASYIQTVTLVKPFDNSYQHIDERVAPALKEMFAAAEKAGVPLYFRSGYRSNATQTSLFYGMLSEYQNGTRTGTPMTYEEAYAATKRYRNIPGTSEHETGLTADIVSLANPYVALTAAFADTAAGKWLAENCAKYGFILRYPADKTSITGTSYEPWHFRYVGVAHATAIMEQGVCLEEYLENA